MIKKVAVSILELCRNGIQVFIATHSLFLLRELDILLQNQDRKKSKAGFSVSRRRRMPPAWNRGAP
ncbi:hypothetical protein JWJ90_00150 [Desulfobulbus rhabdoformis]|nr:hypothetical protein [Desulfobulbus rhabdoformis]